MQDGYLTTGNSPSRGPPNLTVPAHVLGGDAAGGGDIAHRLPVTAIEREGDPHFLAIVAADLEAVRAPTGVADLDGDLPVVSPLFAAAAMTLEQQTVKLHDAVDALRIGRCALVSFRLAAEQSMDPPIAIGRKIGDQPADIGDKLGVG
jgi:hypothetical protein